MTIKEAQKEILKSFTDFFCKEKYWLKNSCLKVLLIKQVISKEATQDKKLNKQFGSEIISRLDLRKGVLSLHN